MSERTQAAIEAEDDLAEAPRGRDRVEFDDAQNREIARIVRRETEKERRRAQVALEAEFQDRYGRELEDAKARAAKLETELQQQRAQAAVFDVAARIGAKQPQLIYRMVRDDLKFDESGNPVEIEEAIKTLRTIAPQMFAPGPSGADGGAGGDVTGADDMNAIIRSEIRRKTRGG